MDCIEKTQVMCTDLVAKNAEMTRAAEKEVATVREELTKEKEEILKDSSQKISDLGSKVAELTSASEAYQKEKSESEALLAKVLIEKAALQAEVESLKKESKKKKMKALKKEIANLENELDDLAVAKEKAEQVTKVGFQDGFCLARHQVLQRFPDLDLSFMAALDIPEGPRWTWSKVEHLNLPFPPPAPQVVYKDAGVGGSQDAEAP